MKSSQNTQIKREVIENIKSDMTTFGITELELLKRLSVVLDVEQFNAKEDESVWLQKVGKAPFVCEVYFDRVWMCDLHESDSHTKLKHKFFKGFLSAYEANKIRLNQLLGVQLAEMKKEAVEKADKELKKSIEALPTATPEEKIAKSIVKEIIEEKTNETPSTIAQ